MPWNKIAVVGLGLLGGSLGLAIQQRRIAQHVAGYVRQPGQVTDCRERQIANEVSTDLGKVVADAELIILTVPIRAMPALSRQMAPFLRAGALVMDVGSVKNGVVQVLEQIIAPTGASFVGAHPMAGAEKTGVRHARANLFHNTVCVLTPTPQTPGEFLGKAAAFWQAIGSTPLRLSPEVHDEMVGRSSHLPHLVAAVLANYILDPALPKEQEMLCATGFRDTTRIASGSPAMWRDIAVANRQPLSVALEEFIAALQRILRALREQDEETIGQFLEKAKQRRDHWCGEGEG